jgi:hypothetical protein
VKKIIKITSVILLLSLVTVFSVSCNLSFIISSEENGNNNQGQVYTINLNYNNFETFNASYSTGNYGEKNISGFKYGYYRMAKDDKNKTMILLNPELNEYIPALPGSFYNISLISDIISIEVTYQTDSEAYIKYGNNGEKTVTYTLPKTSNDYNTKKIEIKNTNFFSIETGKSRVSIKSIVIKFTRDDVEQTSFSTQYNYRINPVVYKGNPMPGATVSVPNEIRITDGKYEVISYKTYTYHTMDEVIQNPSIAHSVALTDPVDIAYYSIAFGTFPVNYVAREDYNDAYEYFKDDTRCFFEYNRTDGYVQSVPYNTKNRDFVYYELDIAISSKGKYNASNRGVGRIVYFKYGFDNPGYDNSPVVVFTDDHYTTFSEFNNYGSFSNRFDAKMTIVFIDYDSINVSKKN